MPDYLGQDLDVDLITVLAPFVRERFFVDVGAEKGSLASLMFSLGMRGALFEPMQRHREALVELARVNGSKAYPWAIDEKDGSRELFVATDPEGNELDYFHSLQRIDPGPLFRHARSIPVPCRSLESLLADGTIPAAVGILKTDTEGNDLFVLKGLGALRPELIVCEYFTEGLYPGWENARPELAIECLRSKGYARYLATKRTLGFEYCTASPAGFLPRQWGNLFALSERLFADAEARIGEFLAGVEARFLAGVQVLAADRAAKEAVIQNLLSR